MNKPFAFSLMLLCLVALMRSYETDTAEDIMECWKKSNAGPSAEEDCNGFKMKDLDYRCCYVTKTSRERENDTKKTCVRLNFDEATIRDYRDRLRDEYKNIEILCTSSNLMMSFGVILFSLMLL